MAFQTSYATSRTSAYAGMLADASAKPLMLTMVNNEATDSMLFGYAVCFEGSTDDQGALKPDAITDVIAGIVVHHHAYDDSELDTARVGAEPEALVQVLRKGRIWVVCADGCSPADRLFIRAVTAGVEEEGALETAADASDMINSTNQGVWLTTATAGNLAILEVDFTAHPNPNP